MGNMTQERKTKIFLDSGDPEETREALKLLGFLDGQTTNPSYFAKSRGVQERLQKQGKFTREQLLEEYKSTIKTIRGLVPNGDISIEVYADPNTTSEEMLRQARDMYGWIQNSHIKFPTIPEGLKAAETAIKEGMRINMTLVFSQKQAAAVYAATLGAKKGDVFVSPFVGRLYDRGENGIDLIKNIIAMYRAGDGHVEVLTASLRHIDQFYAAIALGTDIITAGLGYLKEWAGRGKDIPPADFRYQAQNLKAIPYQEINLNKPWTAYNVRHDLTAAGLSKFAADWNNLII